MSYSNLEKTFQKLEESIVVYKKRTDFKFIVDAQLPKQLADFLNWKGMDAIHTLYMPQANKTTDSYIKHVAILENRI